MSETAKRRVRVQYDSVAAGYEQRWSRYLEASISGTVTRLQIRPGDRLLDIGCESFHVEARIGDSVIVLEIGDPPSPSGTPGSIYVYVPDVDAAYRRALERGATSLGAPEDKPYRERAAGVRDSFGNTWWISTYRG